jgi:hypothetical protein
MNSSFQTQDPQAPQAPPRRSLRLAQKNGEQVLKFLNDYNPEAICFPRLTPGLLGVAVKMEMRAVYDKEKIYALLIEKGTVDTEQEAREWLRRHVLDQEYDAADSVNIPLFL